MEKDTSLGRERERSLNLPRLEVLSTGSYLRLLDYSSALIASYPKLLLLVTASDLAHEAFCEGCKAKSGFQGRTDDELCVWLIGIAHNKARNLLRKHELRKRLPALRGKDLGGADGVLARIAARETPVECVVEEREIAELARSIVTVTLTPMELALIEAIYIDDISVLDLADALHVSAESLRRRVSRLVGKLCQALRRYPWFGDVSNG